MYNNCLSSRRFPRRKIFGQNPSVRSFVKKCRLGVQILIVVFLSTQQELLFVSKGVRTPHNFYLNVENAPAGS